MRSRNFQGTAGYVTRMSGGVGGRGREAFFLSRLGFTRHGCIDLSDANGDAVEALLRGANDGARHTGHCWCIELHRRGREWTKVH